MFNIFRRLSTWNLIYDWRFHHPVTSTDETINLFISVVKWKGISFPRFQLFLKSIWIVLKLLPVKVVQRPQLSTTGSPDLIMLLSTLKRDEQNRKSSLGTIVLWKWRGEKKSFPCFEIKLEKIEREFRRHQSLWRFNIQREWSNSWHHHHLNSLFSSLVPTHKKLLTTSAIASLRPRCLRSNLLIDRTGGRNKYKSGWDEQE